MRSGGQVDNFPDQFFNRRDATKFLQKTSLRGLKRHVQSGHRYAISGRNGLALEFLKYAKSLDTKSGGVAFVQPLAISGYKPTSLRFAENPFKSSNFISADLHFSTLRPRVYRWTWIGHRAIGAPIQPVFGVDMAWAKNGNLHLPEFGVHPLRGYNRW